MYKRKSNNSKKKEIIPSVVEFLTGDIQARQEQKEYTLTNFAQDYFTVHQKEVRANTYKRNLLNYNKHILPYFGHRLLDSIKPMELETWQYKLLDNYSVGSVQIYRTTLYSIFEMAFKNEIIKENPLKKVKSPKLNKNFNKNNNNKVDPFNQTQLKQILDNTNGYMHNFILFMYATGLRPDEIISLSWNDIDFKRKIINVTKTMTAGNTGDVKTLSSNRIVDMLPLATKALQNQLKITKDKDYIFLNRWGRPFYSHDIINSNFKKILIKNNIKARKLYNLRHTFASTLISNGADIVWVSKMLGYKDVNITLSTYTKYINEDDNIRFKKIDEMGTKMGTVLK
jgi:integrase